MSHWEGRPAARRNENLLGFVPSRASASGARALDLVYQAADVFSTIEDNAREIEARAQAMCKGAAEHVRQAKQQAESAEHSLRRVIADADLKLRDASKALKQAELRITAAEDKATALEIRAHVAEVESRETKDALALVEEAIRRRLLCASPEAARGLHEVA